MLDAHAQKAAASEYDRSVCISAVAAARSTISEYIESTGPHINAEVLMQRLQQLHTGYHDPDGEYTSGKGVVGDLIADLGAVLKASNL